MEGVVPLRGLEPVSRGAQAPYHVVYDSLCASVFAHILKGTTMRSILGLVVTVVVIVIVLRLLGVL